MAPGDDGGAGAANAAVAMPVEFLEWLGSKTEEEENWDKEEVYKYLCQKNQNSKTGISRQDLAMPIWTRLSMWQKKGLQFRVENKELAEALKTWCNTTIDPDAREEREEEELVRTMIEKRGVFVKPLDNDNDLRSAVQQWNEKNKNQGEHFKEI